MNIVDVIKSQLSNEVLGKLSSIIGESEEKTKTAATGTVPALLSVLAHLASSSSGADKVINALKQVDSGASGGIGDILSGRTRTGPGERRQPAEYPAGSRRSARSYQHAKQVRRDSRGPRQEPAQPSCSPDS